MSLSTRSLTDAQDLMSMKKEGEPASDRAMKLKKSWNDFQEWLGKKGLVGHPELDKGVGEDNGGIKAVRQYQKENPNTLVTPENIPEIQKHFQNYREFVINKLRTDPKHNQITDPKTGISRSALPNENLDFFMRELSKVDGLPGQLTSKHRFPSEFLTTIYKDPSGKVEKTTVEDKGLVKN